MFRKTDLVIIPGNLNAQRYIDEVMEPHVVPMLRNIGQHSIFMDDNASCHRARVVNNFVQDENITCMDWPACSPDLNPIENLWDYLGRQLQARIQEGDNLNDVLRYLQEEWNQIPLNRI